MGKVTLEFDSREEKNELTAALKGMSYWRCLYAISDEFRRICKHTPEDMTDETIVEVERLRQFFFETLDDYHCNLDEIE